MINESGLTDRRVIFDQFIRPGHTLYTIAISFQHFKSHNSTYYFLIDSKGSLTSLYRLPQWVRQSGQMQSLQVAPKHVPSLPISNYRSLLIRGRCKVIATLTKNEEIKLRNEGKRQRDKR